MSEGGTFGSRPEDNEELVTWGSGCGEGKGGRFQKKGTMSVNALRTELDVFEKQQGEQYGCEQG